MLSGDLHLCNLLTVAPKKTSTICPFIATVLSIANPLGPASFKDEVKGEKATQFACDYCGGQHHNTKKSYKCYSEAAEKSFSV